MVMIAFLIGMSTECLKTHNHLFSWLFSSPPFEGKFSPSFFVMRPVNSDSKSQILGVNKLIRPTNCKYFCFFFLLKRRRSIIKMDGTNKHFDQAIALTKRSYCPLIFIKSPSKLFSFYCVLQKKIIALL